MTRLLVLLFFASITWCAKAQDTIPTEYPARGFAIAVPSPANLDSFIVFINKELAPRGINYLVLRVDYNYQYSSHPELVAPDALSHADVQKLVQACRAQSITIIPQINLLGHQSWEGQLSKLLAVYPQFDETPWVKMPEKYTWPNADSLYCKSYCPLHPGVHKVVFDLIDEICDAFGATAFHAGMDEVFYIGMGKCPRCHGKDRGKLFAGEVRRIHDHLAERQRKLWIWGDRLIDGRTTGIGEWEGSYNGTWTAIDQVPKDVMICDWHYERPDKTAVLFAARGFQVITCPWNMPEVAVAQVADMRRFRRESTPEIGARFYGIMQTVWSGVGAFFHDFYGNPTGSTAGGEKGQAATFRASFPVLKTQ